MTPHTLCTIVGIFLLDSLVGLAQPEIICNPEQLPNSEPYIFYVSDNNFDLDESYILRYSLDGSLTTFLDTLFYSDGLYAGIGIAYDENNELNMYCEMNQIPAEFEGENFVISAIPDLGRNFSGHGNHLWASSTFEIGYYNHISGLTHMIDIQYLFPDAPQRVKPADMAVDNEGNAWVITGPDIANTWMTTSLLCFDTTGTLIGNYDLEINAQGAYGMMYARNQLYLGCKEPSTFGDNLIPIVISGSSAMTSSPINFGNNETDFNDLASCNSDDILNVDHAWITGINVFPNPAKDQLYIRKNGDMLNVDVYSITGELQNLHPNIRSQFNNIDLSELSPGIYVFHFSDVNGRTITTERIVKQ